MSEKLTRRNFFKLVGTAGTAAVLTACAPPAEPNTDSPITIENKPSLEPWETPAVLSMGLVLGEAPPELRSLILVQGFRVKNDVSIIVGQSAINAGEPGQTFKMIKAAGGGMPNAVYYDPETQIWLKVLESPTTQEFATRVARFEKTVEATKISISIGYQNAGFSAESGGMIPELVDVQIGENVYKAMEIRNIGPSLRVLVSTNQLTPEEITAILGRSYINALQLGREGFWFADNNLDNILVATDDSGNMLPELICNIDFNNARLVVGKNQLSFLRSSLLTKYETLARKNRLIFNPAAAETRMDTEMLGKFTSQKPVIDDQLIITTGDAAGTTEEIKLVSPVDATQTPLADDTLMATANRVDDGAAATETWLMRTLRHPLFQKAGAILKVFGDMGLAMWVADLVDGPNKKTEWGEAKIWLDEKTLDYALNPEEEHAVGIEYKRDYRLWELPNEMFAQFAKIEKQRFAHLKEEVTSWGINPQATDTELDNFVLEQMKDDPTDYKDASMLARKLYFGGPGGIDQPRASDINFSSLAIDGKKLFIVWRDIPHEAENVNFDDYILLVLESSEDSQWKTIKNGGDVTVHVPGTNSSTAAKVGWIEWGEDGFIHFKFDENQFAAFFNETVNKNFAATRRFFTTLGLSRLFSSNI